MKRAFLILTVLLTILLFSVVVSADSMWEYEEYTYGETEGVVVTKYLGTETDLYIPSTIDGKAVLKIGDEAFKNNDTYTVSYSPLNYVKTVIDTQSDMKLVNLAKAFFLYYEASEAYALHKGDLIPGDNESYPSEW